MFLPIRSKKHFRPPKHYDALGAILKIVVADDFGACGLELVDFFINSITLPEDVQRVVDEKTSMNTIGTIGTYMKYKTARSIEEAAKQPGWGKPVPVLDWVPEWAWGLMLRE